jgi:hypothetical protein
MACLAMLHSVVGTASAQPGRGCVAVGFRNETNTTVIVQGYSIVNGMKKSGPLIRVPPKATFYDVNAPINTPRFYTVYDANNNQALGSSQVPVGGQDMLCVIRQGPTGKIALLPGN